MVPAGVRESQAGRGGEGGLASVAEVCFCEGAVLGRRTFARLRRLDGDVLRRVVVVLLPMGTTSQTPL